MFQKYRNLHVEGQEINGQDLKTFYQKVKKATSNSPDLSYRIIQLDEQKIIVLYISTMTELKEMEERIIGPLQTFKEKKVDLKDVNSVLSSRKVRVLSRYDEIANDLQQGHTVIFGEGFQEAISVKTTKTIERSIEKAETESLVYGPRMAFTDSLLTNMNIVKQTVKDPNLQIDQMAVGERNAKEVRIVYIRDIADSRHVDLIKERIRQLKIDDALDSAVLAQLIEDRPFTIFPQFMLTELPDRFAYSLLNGKIAIFLDRSSNVIICPTNFLSFFESTEELYMRWNMATFTRWLRFVFMFISIIITPSYVAVLTYHYEMIPSALMISLGKSRANVPFPPVFEAITLELIIELLREAGARLPTKVGQTMGIVGGIVIGQAAVQAGLTSNILIIIVAISALATFTAPNYLMGTAIRLIRFPMIFLSGIFGLIGVAFGLSFLLIHLLRITSLNAPYLAPQFPLRIKDLQYSLLRLPYGFSRYRPITNRPVDKKRRSSNGGSI